MSNPTVIDGYDELAALVGKQLGYSDFVEITQGLVEAFANTTGDTQWIHVDPERASTEGPFGGTIAHGALTFSLGPALLPTIIEVTGFSMGLNYGFNRGRFPSPVLVGSHLRMGVVLDSFNLIAGGCEVELTQTFEVEGTTKPALVCQVVYRYYE